MPRRGSAHRGRRDTDISEFVNLTPETLKQQRLSLEELDTYLLVAGVACCIDELVVVPPLFAEVLRAFGVHLYRTGRPLYIYLMAVTAIQRLHPALRVHFGAVWSLAESWRCLEPTVHRIPVPLRLFQAVCAVAISLGWLRFAGVCMISFLGPARIGEPMRAKRMHLVLPEDTLYEHVDKVFLHIVSPKTGAHFGARTQHVTVRGKAIATMLERAFASLGPDEKLYPFADATFRRRWDEILYKVLLLPRSLHFTPGGLRGGGAVSAYTSDVPIETIRWRMRISNNRTLGHYLQEVTAASSLSSLAPKSREAVSLFSKLYLMLCLPETPSQSA